MTLSHRVLVVGSYPPIPRPAAAATVAAVRQAWANGDEVTVVSPRLSAADLAVPVVGVLAGRRLTNLRRHTSASRLVLVLEPGMPVPAVRAGQPVGGMEGQPVGGMVGQPVGRRVDQPVGRLVDQPVGRLEGSSAGQLLGWLHQWLTVRAVGAALAGFDHVTFVRVGDLAISPRIETRLLGSADEVVDHPAPSISSPEATGVTAFGPVEVTPRERPRQVAGALARWLLGPYAGSLRARAAAIRRSLRR